MIVAAPHGGGQSSGPPSAPGLVGFAAIMHAGDREVERARLPCAPETPCNVPIQEGPNVARAFLPVAYLIMAGTGAAAGALVGAGLGALVGR